MRPFIFIFLFSSCFWCAAQNSNKVYLDSLFSLNEMVKILDLDDTKDNFPVRVFDIAGKFDSCGTMIKSNNWISVDIYHKLTYNINIGLYRDVIIDSFYEEDGGYTMNVFMTDYLCTNDKKNYYLFVVYFKEKENSIKVVSSKLYHKD